MEHIRNSHLKATKKIMFFVKRSSSYGLFYSSSQNFKFTGYCDNDLTEDKKSTIGFVLYSRKFIFTCPSKKQSIIALSTCEV